MGIGNFLQASCEFKPIYIDKCQSVGFNSVMTLIFALLGRVLDEVP